MADSVRNVDLKQMLTVRRSEMCDDVQSRVRQGRTAQRTDARDDIDLSDADIQGDLEFALIQMRSDTLSRIDVALSRLAAGDYGACVDCKEEIAPRRLHALPFAVRCQGCEERREQTQGRARRLTQQRGSFTLFPDTVGS